MTDQSTIIKQSIEKPFYIEGMTANEYRRLHYWLSRNFGKANRCELSDCQGTSKDFEWAKIRDKEYEYKRENFMMLCRRCHSSYDFTEKTIEKRRKPREYMRKAVIRTDKDGKEVRYASMMEAEKATGTRQSTIHHVLKGDYKQRGGYEWKFADGFTIRKNENKLKKNVQSKHVMVQEWFEKRGNKVFMIWEFEDGKQLRRLTPYNELPYVEVEL